MKTLVLAFFCLMLSGIAGAAPPSYIDGTDGGKVAALKTLGGGGTNFLGANYVTVPKQTITDKTVAAPAQQGVPAYAAIAWAKTDSAYPAVRQPVAMGALVQLAGALEVTILKMPGFTASIIGNTSYVPKAVTLASAPCEVSLSGVCSGLAPMFTVVAGAGSGSGHSSSILS